MRAALLVLALALPLAAEDAPDDARLIDQLSADDAAARDAAEEALAKRGKEVLPALQAAIEKCGEDEEKKARLSRLVQRVTATDRIAKFAATWGTRWFVIRGKEGVRGSHRVQMKIEAGVLILEETIRLRGSPLWTSTESYRCDDSFTWLAQDDTNGTNPTTHAENTVGAAPGTIVGGVYSMAFRAALLARQPGASMPLTLSQASRGPTSPVYHGWKTGWRMTFVGTKDNLLEFEYGPADLPDEQTRFLTDADGVLVREDSAGTVVEACSEAEAEAASKEEELPK